MHFGRRQQRTTNSEHVKLQAQLSIFDRTISYAWSMEEEEDLVDPDYLRRWQSTRRANRLFRNIWHQRKANFAEFKTLVEDTWPGMTISPPELHGFSPPHLTMFCTENRIDREICWAGFGFQVWLQLLTHLLGALDATTMVIDEPEIYLHPDLQRRLFLLLKSSNKQLIVATHSSEIVNEAEHDEILLVNRTRRRAKRIGDIDGLQEALFTIGSGQNIHLARLSRGRKILFFEGDDIKLMKKFASRLGLRNFENETSVTIVPLGGFSHREKIADAAWTFEKVLQAEIAIAAVLDRDYRCQEEIDQIKNGVPASIPNFFILNRKELENYLLDSRAITSAINDRLATQMGRPHADLCVSDVEQILNAIADNSKSALLSQMAAHRVRFFEGRTRNDASTVFNEAIAYLDSRWDNAFRQTRRGGWQAVPFVFKCLSAARHGHFHHSNSNPQDSNFARELRSSKDSGRIGYFCGHAAGVGWVERSEPINRDAGI
jgi:hypothetical protein